MLPVTTVIGLQTGLLLSGAVLTEMVFAWGGMGTCSADGRLQPGLSRAPRRRSCSWPSSSSWSTSSSTSSTASSIPGSGCHEAPANGIARHAGVGSSTPTPISRATVATASAARPAPHAAATGSPSSAGRSSSSSSSCAASRPLLAPYDPRDNAGRPDPADVDPGPSREHWFGLDEAGRDEFSRIIYGARASLLIGVLSLTARRHRRRCCSVCSPVRSADGSTVVMRFIDMHAGDPRPAVRDRRRRHLGRSYNPSMIAIAVAERPDVRPAAARLDARRATERTTCIAAHVARRATKRRIVHRPHPAQLAGAGASCRRRWRWRPPSSTPPRLAFLGLGSADPSIPEWGRMLADTQRYLPASHRSSRSSPDGDRDHRARLQPVRRSAARSPRPEAAR